MPPVVFSKMRLLIAILAILVGANTMAAGQKDESVQKQELEQLINATLPFAAQMLTKRGEFYPFGATMDPSNKITSVGGYNGSEHPKSTEIIDLLKGAFQRQAETNAIMACALVYDIRTIPPGQTQKTDAIEVDLEHRDGLSLIVVYPYKIGPDKNVELASPFATKGKGEIFKRTPKAQEGKH
jgi:hypothetical protein